MDEELVRCSQINFENLEKAFPQILLSPYYRIAKAQLDEALGGMTTDEKFALDVKRAQKNAND
jgi:hypothetical protein